jgi:hypothetical protein
LKTWTVIMLLFISVMDFAHAQSAGQIVGIKGTAFLRAAPNAKPETLTSKHDLNRTLNYDDEISCKAGAQVDIQLTGGVPYNIKGPSVWTPLPHLSSAAVTELNDYFRRGGRERGERPALVSPAPEGVVPAKSLTFQWTPMAGVKIFTMTVFSPQQAAWFRRLRGKLCAKSAPQSARVYLL